VKPGEAVTLWAISVDPAADSKGFSEKIAKDGQGPIGFPLLSDPESRTIDAYGLRDPRYAKIRRDGIPSPTTYVIDRAGRVAWSRIDRDHKLRPSNDEIRAALATLK